MSIPTPRPLQPRGLRQRIPASFRDVGESLRHLQSLINRLTSLSVKTVTFVAVGDGAFDTGYNSAFSGQVGEAVPLEAGNRDTPPSGLIAISVKETKDPTTSPVLATAVLQAVWVGGNRTLAFVEPGGLIADTNYTLTVLIIG